MCLKRKAKVTFTIEEVEIMTQLLIDKYNDLQANINRNDSYKGNYMHKQAEVMKIIKKL